MSLLAVLGFALALLPLLMTAANLRQLRTPPLPAAPPAIAILVPARNEAGGIARCLRAALASTGVDLEVIVLDDHSTDGTGAVVEALAREDPRLKLVRGPPLPAGWNGKQHACAVLGRQTDRPNLLFIDADVVLAPEAAARLAPSPGVDLVSGVPRQLMPSLAERLTIPMINALILGYLPIAIMRQRPDASLAAGCGQMMMVRASAYRTAGGHGAIRASLHDGLKLPRAFRARGLVTDLVDGTSLATCRMYDSPAAVWRGFLKNATEGMATPRALPVWTLLLAGGHLLPWLLLLAAWRAGATDLQWALVIAGCAMPLAARLMQALRCREPVAAVPLHPLAVVATLVIQWTALIRQRLGVRTDWRGRAYLPER